MLSTAVRAALPARLPVCAVPVASVPRASGLHNTVVRAAARCLATAATPTTDASDAMWDAMSKANHHAAAAGTGDGALQAAVDSVSSSPSHGGSGTGTDDVLATSADAGAVLAALDGGGAANRLPEDFGRDPDLLPVADTLGFDPDNQLLLSDFDTEDSPEDHYDPAVDPLRTQTLISFDNVSWTSQDNFIRKPFNHAINYKVAMEVTVADLGVDAATADMMAHIAGPRYNPRNGRLKMVTKHFDSVAKNKRRLMEQLYDLAVEADAIVKEFGDGGDARVAA